VPVSDEWASLLAALRSPTPDATSHDELVRLALDLSHDIAEDTVGCSLTEIDGAGYRTPVASNSLALELDQAQYAAASGPCVNAVRDRQLQRIDAIGADERWPVFSAAAREHGVRSSLSYPVAGTAHPTALNVYSATLAAFDSPHSIAVAALLARCIRALSLAGYSRGTTEGDAAERSARDQGQRVGGAVEHLMRRRASSRSEAFAELAIRSRSEHGSIAQSAELELTEREQPS
jgi:hypothetical protein